MVRADGTVTRRGARLLLLVAAAFGVLLMHSLGPGSQAGTDHDMGLMAVHSTMSPIAKTYVSPATGVAVYRAASHPMPLDEMSICLAVLLAAAALIRLRRASAAGEERRSELGGGRAGSGLGGRAPPPSPQSLLAAQTVVLRN